MSETKHTPGPWKWFSNNDRIYLATPDRGRLIVMDFTRKGMQRAQPRFRDIEHCRMYNAEHFGSVPDHNGEYEILHPDAILIAAAPDLLELLDSCEHWLSYPAVTNSDKFCVVNLIKKCREMIAKIKGEQ